jgi:hypothetical protein
MRKTIAILAAAALTSAALTTGCDVDADFAGVYNVYNIPVQPSEWEIMSPDPGIIAYMYVDKRMPELDASVIGRAAYVTYYQYMDGNQLVEVPLPHHVYNLETEVDGEYRWQYTIEAEYSPGNLRLKLSTSDFDLFRPNEEWVFRLAIIR